MAFVREAIVYVCVQVWESLYNRADQAERGMYITTLLLHPRSIGTIRLQSSNPQDDPLIDPKLLTEADDVHTLIDGKCTASLAASSLWDVMLPRFHF